MDLCVAFNNATSSPEATQLSSQMDCLAVSLYSAPSGPSASRDSLIFYSPATGASDGLSLG